MSDVRARIAPSNTGSDVHIGNVRTALFNFLFTKQNKGSFVFRIENSDIARSKDEYADAIAESFNWLGLVADEGYKCSVQDHGPYMQTHKLDRYQQVAEQLIAAGHAYRCYCTPEELAAQRAIKNDSDKDVKSFPKYPGTCRDRKDQPNDKNYVIRLKAPTEGSIEWDDMVFGKISVPNKENFDWVIMRSNGIPLYNFGCCVDDLDQGITHVIRGRDHIINTNIQIFIHQLLGTPAIKFAHLPMMLNQQGQKLSKRDGAVTISEYRNSGYSPNAVLNYLAKFGWGLKDKEIFTLEELIRYFSLESCGKTDGKFDPVKFASINYAHLKSEELTPDIQYAKLLKPFIDAKKIGDYSIEQLIPYIAVVRSRAKTFIEAANFIEPMLTEMRAPNELIAKTFTAENITYLQNINMVLCNLDVWNETTLRTSVQDWLNAQKLTLKDVGATVRVALLGQANSPEIFHVLSVMGKATTISRINKTLAQLKS